MSEVTSEKKEELHPKPVDDADHHVEAEATAHVARDPRNRQRHERQRGVEDNAQQHGDRAEVVQGVDALFAQRGGRCRGWV